MITVEQYLRHCDDALAVVERTRTRLHDDACAASLRERPTAPAFEDDGTISYATQGDVLLHVTRNWPSTWASSR